MSIVNRTELFYPTVGKVLRRSTQDLGSLDDVAFKSYYYFIFFSYLWWWIRGVSAQMLLLGCETIVLRLFCEVGFELNWWDRIGRQLHFSVLLDLTFLIIWILVSHDVICLLNDPYHFLTLFIYNVNSINPIVSRALKHHSHSYYNIPKMEISMD